MLPGLIMGGVPRIHRLCSDPKDVETKLVKFYYQVLERGYQATNITAFFNRAIKNTHSYLNQSQEQRGQLRESRRATDKRRVFLYLLLPYHRNDPSSYQLQQFWRRTVQNLSGKAYLNHLVQRDRVPVPIGRLVIVYSRAPNIDNLFSYRKIYNQPEPKVLSYWIKHQ